MCLHVLCGPFPGRHSQPHFTTSPVSEFNFNLMLFIHSLTHLFIYIKTIIKEQTKSYKKSYSLLSVLDIDSLHKHNQRVCLVGYPSVSH